VPGPVCAPNPDRNEGGWTSAQHLCGRWPDRLNPTGSTAYALAAGGPILPPELRNILIIPVAPHFSMDRAIILSQGAGVTMTVHTSHEAVMSVDGQPPVPMLDGDFVRVTSNDYTIHFVRFQDPATFTAILPLIWNKTR
jgi:NAD kinase